MNVIALPSVVPFAAAIRYLGLEGSHSYSSRSASILLRLVNEYDLAMYLVGSEIFGVLEWVVQEECYEDFDTGNIQQLEPIEPDKFFSHELYVRLTDGLIKTNESGNSDLDISHFEVEACRFYTTNAGGTIGASSYSFDACYFSLDDLTKLKEKFTEPPQEKLSVGKGGLSIQNQRERAFKFWLGSKATNKLITGGKVDFQKCYELAGSLTQDLVWKKLQQIDAKLFSQGKDDFFKHQNLVNFKMGTGSSRS